MRRNAQDRKHVQCTSTLPTETKTQPKKKIKNKNKNNARDLKREREKREPWAMGKSWAVRRASRNNTNSPINLCLSRMIGYVVASIERRQLRLPFLLLFILFCYILHQNECISLFFCNIDPCLLFHYIYFYAHFFCLTSQFLGLRFNLLSPCSSSINRCIFLFRYAFIPLQNAWLKRSQFSHENRLAIETR